MKGLLRLLPVLLAAATTTAHAALSASPTDSLEWVSLGPSGGNANILAIHPTEPNLLLAGNGANLLWSADGGEHWRPGPDLSNTGALDMARWDPSGTRTVYLRDHRGLVRCDLEGSRRDTVRGGLPEQSATALAILPGGRKCYAGSEYGLFQSADGGVQWRCVWSRMERYSVSCVAALAGTRRVLFGSVHGTIFKSEDDGLSWSEVHRGETSIDEIVPQPADPRVLFARTDRGVLLRSTDSGTSWVRMAMPIAKTWALAVDPGSSRTVYAGSSLEDLQVSTDAGGQWRPVKAGTRVSPPWPRLNVLQVDPHDSNTLYAGTTQGVFKSEDAGLDWRPLNNGLNLTPLWRLVLDPGESRAVLASGWAMVRLSESAEGGTWESDRAIAGLPPGFISELVVAASQPTVFYAVVAGGEAGLHRSRDRGHHWSAIGDGLFRGVGPLSVNALAVDPVSPTTLYAQSDTTRYYSDYGIVAARLSKSTDGGDSWRPATEGLDLGVGNQLIVDPVDPQAVYFGSSGGLFKSSDGGARWTRVDIGGLDRGLQLLAVVPTRRSTIFVSAYSSLLASRDRGASWSPSGAGIPADRRVLCLVADPQQPEYLYAAAALGMFASCDGGISWRPIGHGTGPARVSALAVDPLNGDLFAAASSGVWLLRAARRHCSP